MHNFIALPECEKFISFATAAVWHKTMKLERK